jgi:hypothetical protein
MPFSAMPVTATGKSGLFVIPSYAVGSSPAPTPSFVTTAEPTLLGATFAIVGTLTNPTYVTPALLVYSAKGTDGKLHLYGLNLANPSNSSTPPKPVQITNLAVPTTKAICAAGQSQSNLTVPTTLSVVIHVATPQAGSQPGQEGYCAGVPTGTYYLAPYTASASTAPTILKIPGGTSTKSAIENDGEFTPLNMASGLLGGILYWDSVTQAENFYSTPAGFNTGPSKVPLSGVKGTPVACIGVYAASNGILSSLGGDYLAAANTTKGFASYAFTPTGVADEFFAGQASQCNTDATHLFFIGTASGGTTAAIYEEASPSLTGLLTLLPGVTSSSTLQYNLIGSNTAVVVFDKSTFALTGESTNIETVPVGVKSTSAKTIGGPYAGALFTAFLAAPKGQPAIDDQLFVSLANETISGTTVKVSYSSQLLSPSTGKILTPPANTVWQSFGALTNELEGGVLEVTGITDTNGGFGGASLELWPVGGTSGMAITLTGGASYKVPANYELFLSGFYGTAMAEGALLSRKNQASIGAAFNASKRVIVPISLLNTNVLPIL